MYRHIHLDFMYNALLMLVADSHLRLSILTYDRVRRSSSKNPLVYRIIALRRSVRIEYANMLQLMQLDLDAYHSTSLLQVCSCIPVLFHTLLPRE